MDWECSEGFFKCRTTGKCVPESKVCDGHFDCESGTGDFVSYRTYNNDFKSLIWPTDSSDEADCPCQEETDINSVYFRRMLLPLLQIQCGNDTAADVELKRCTMEVLVAENDTVEVSMTGIALLIKVMSLESFTLRTTRSDYTYIPMNGSRQSYFIPIKSNCPKTCKVFWGREYTELGQRIQHRKLRVTKQQPRSFP